MKVGGKKAQQQLVAELCHKINSPLAAIRNALYLSATRTDDPELRRYLALADAEITSIAAILRQARALLGDLSGPESKPAEGCGRQESRRAAA